MIMMNINSFFVSIGNDILICLMNNGDQGTVFKHQLEDFIKIPKHVILKHKASFKLCDDFNRTLKII